MPKKTTPPSTGRTSQHRHYGRPHRPLSITGICTGIPLPGETRATQQMLQRHTAPQGRR